MNEKLRKMPFPYSRSADTDSTSGRKTRPLSEEFESELRSELQQLKANELHRTLRETCGRLGPRMSVDGRDVLMFAGANYLGLAGDSRVVDAACGAMKDYGCAAGGARLISGNLPLHNALEHDLARFVGTEAALMFSTGYMANLGVISAFAGSGDVVVSDSLNHASIIDACRMSQAKTLRFRHNDPADLARVAANLTGFRWRILVVEGVYSMDGDVAALNDMVSIARNHEMLIVLDDAHGFGILGSAGRGTAEQAGVEVDVQIGNLGKALGSFGAFVACSSVVRDYLINTCRPFIFTCGLAPAVVAAAHAALRIIEVEPQRRHMLLERATQLRDGLRDAGCDTGLSATHIVPIIVGENRAAMQLCERALALGVYAQGIRYPSVPRGSARLRFTPLCSHTPGDIKTAIEVVRELRNET